MTWTSPMTAVDGQPLSASQFNTYVRNNLNETAPAKLKAKGFYVVPDGPNSLAARKIVSAFDSNSIGIAAGSEISWVDGGGPAVSCITGTSAMVIIGAHMANEADDRMSGIGYAISGSTNRGITTGVNNDGPYSIIADGMDPGTGSGNAIRQSGMFLEKNLNPGTNVFTMKYVKSNSGLCTYLIREIIVIPL